MLAQCCAGVFFLYGDCRDDEGREAGEESGSLYNGRKVRTATAAMTKTAERPRNRGRCITEVRMPCGDCRDDEDRGAAEESGSLHNGSENAVRRLPR